MVVHSVHDYEEKYNICGKNSGRKLHVEPEQDNIPILYHIFLALGADQALLPGGGHGAAGHQVLVGDHLGPDEAPLKVGVDLAGGLGSLSALGDGPGPALVLAAGEVGDEAQQSVAGLDQTIQAGLFYPQILQEHGLLLRLQLGDLRLQLGTHGDHLGALRLGPLLYLLVVGDGLGIGKAVLIQVGGIDDGLEGEQLAGADEGGVILLHLVEKLLVALGGLLGLVNAAVHHLRVGQNELQVNGIHIPDGIRGALHVDDVLVVKAAHHMDNSIGHADVGQKFVAQTLAPAGAIHQTGDVHKLDDSGGSLLGVVHFTQLVQPLVGHCHHTHIGVNGAEGVVGALGAGVGDGVEQGALPNIWKAHDS